MVMGGRRWRRERGAGRARWLVLEGLEGRVLMAGSPYAGFSNGPPTDPNFFPIGVWYQNLTNATIDGYAAMGVNVYVYPDTGMTTTLLTRIKNDGMYAVLPQDAFGLGQVANKTIIGWFNPPDEPDNAQWNGSTYTDPINPQTEISQYNTLHAADATRPILLNLGQGVAWDGWVGRGARTGHTEDYGYNSTYKWTNGVTYTGGYTKGSDIAAFDFYPENATNAAVAGKMSVLANGVNRLVGWSAPGHPVWNYIETTDITVGDSAPGPTPAQVKAEVWLSLVHGSMGIVYFAHQFPGSTHALLDDPVMHPAVTAIDTQIKSLAPVLNSATVSSGTMTTGVGGAVHVDFMTKNYGGDSYVFGVTPQDGSVGSNGANSGAAMFRDASKGAVDGTVEVIGENRTVPLVDGVFRDTFATAGVHLYRVIGVSGFTPASSAVVVTGDINGDGTVNFADFVILSNNYGTASGQGGGVGELNGDGTVNFGDFVILSNNYGATAGLLAGADAGVTTAAALVTDAAPSKKKRWRGRRGHEKVKVQGLDVMQMTMLQDVRGRR
jgi:hypothetical protein